MYIIVMISFVVHNNGSVDSMQAEKNLMEISKFDKNKTTFFLATKGVIGSCCTCCTRFYLFLQHQIQNNQAFNFFLKPQLLK